MTRHLPIEIPVGPWQCIDRACHEGEYEDAEGNDRPEITWCSHVTILVLCETCSGWTEQHGVRNEATWADCILRGEMRTTARALREAGPYIVGKVHRLADPVAAFLEQAAVLGHPMSPSQQHIWEVAATTVKESQ